MKKCFLILLISTISISCNPVPEDTDSTTPNPSTKSTSTSSPSKHNLTPDSSTPNPPITSIDKDVIYPMTQNFHIHHLGKSILVSDTTTKMSDKLHKNRIRRQLGNGSLNVLFSKNPDTSNLWIGCTINRYQPSLVEVPSKDEWFETKIIKDTPTYLEIQNIISGHIYHIVLVKDNLVYYSRFEDSSLNNKKIVTLLTNSHANNHISIWQQKPKDFYDPQNHKPTYRTTTLSHIIYNYTQEKKHDSMIYLYYK